VHYLLAGAAAALADCSGIRGRSINLVIVSAVRQKRQGEGGGLHMIDARVAQIWLLDLVLFQFGTVPGYAPDTVVSIAVSATHVVHFSVTQARCACAAQRACAVELWLDARTRMHRSCSTRWQRVRAVARSECPPRAVSVMTDAARRGSQF
jgi:hypothetical protein